MSPDTLTPWKEELLWRLYVDTYNHLTYGYADDLIEMDHAGLEVVVAGRPADISGVRDAGRFSTACRAATWRCSVWRRSTVTSGWRATSGPNEVALLAREARRHLGAVRGVARQAVSVLEHLAACCRTSAWTSFAAQAMTTPGGLALDVFEFSDERAVLRRRTRPARRRFDRVLQAVVAGAIDVTTLLRGKERSVLYRRALVGARRSSTSTTGTPQRYTVLEIVADDAPACCTGSAAVMSRSRMRRRSRADLRPKGKKAIDVLHVTQAEATSCRPTTKRR